MPQGSLLSLLQQTKMEKNNPLCISVMPQRVRKALYMPLLLQHHYFSIYISYPNEEGQDDCPHMAGGVLGDES